MGISKGELGNHLSSSKYETLWQEQKNEAFVNHSQIRQIHLDFNEAT